MDALKWSVNTILRVKGKGMNPDIHSYDNTEEIFPRINSSIQKSVEKFTSKL